MTCEGRHQSKDFSPGSMMTPERIARASKLVLLVNLCTILMNLSAFASSSNVARPQFASTFAATSSSRQRLNNKTNHQQQQQHQHQAQERNSRLLLAATTSQASEQTSALVYLQKYGYMQASARAGETNNLVSEESFSGAVTDFQRFAGLAQTGVVDEQTLELMRTPRCGNSDKWRPTLGPANSDTTTVSSSSGNSGMLVRANRTVISKSGQLASRHFLASQSGIDNEQPEVKRRRKRYALQGSKWRRQELTYRISQYPSRFSGKRHEVDEQIRRAFGIWSQVAPIDFVVKKEGRVHIDIRFASGDHGDGDAFDGPGNTLAHAYFPQYGGDAHFDDQEYWTIDSYAGTNIFQVAAHELGHSLGLGHSNVREALMAPFYQKYKPHFKLHVDDILAIQALYGEKMAAPDPPPAPSTASPDTASSGSRPFPGIYRGGGGVSGSSPRRPTTTSTSTTSTTTTTTTTEEPPSETSGGGGSASSERPEVGGPERDERENGIPEGAGEETPHLGPGSSHGPGILGTPAYPADLCTNGAIDAITRTEDGNTYVFKGDFYWLLVNEGLAKNYPRRISLDWDGLPADLDAALTWADGKTFFFKGNKYWRFKNKRRDLGYPKLISAGFAGIPDDLDAALVWSGNGRTYFFKGHEYWRFDSKAEPPVSAEYPRSIKVWTGVPAHLNAAFKWENNVTYFFKGNQYYRFNDKEFRVETRGRPPFPRQTGEWWFGCVNSNLPQRALSGSLRHHHQQAVELQTSSSPPTGHRAQAQQQISAGREDDWSLLAGLSEDATRPLGTHISDHQKPIDGVQKAGTGAPTSSTSEVESSQLDELAPGWLADGQPEPRAELPPSVISKRAGWLPPSASNDSGSGFPFHLDGLFTASAEDAQRKVASSSVSPAILNWAHHLIGALLTSLGVSFALPSRRRRSYKLVN